MTEYRNISNDNAILSVNDILDNKANDIHRQMFDYAIKRYCASNSLDYDAFTDENILVDICNDAYYLPSEVKVISKKNMQSSYVKLDEYWPDFYYFPYIDENHLGGTVLMYADYVRNYAQFFDKNKGIEFCLKLTDLKK